MDVFFSGTDKQELVTNSEHHNFYLSLIVNNRNEMTAKVAFRTKIEKKITVEPTFNFRDIKGIWKSLVGKTATKQKEETVVMYIDCEIEKPRMVDDRLYNNYLKVAADKKFEDGEFINRRQKPAPSLFDGYSTGPTDLFGNPLIADIPRPPIPIYSEPVEEKKKTGPKGPWKHKRFEQTIQQSEGIQKEAYSFLVNWIGQDLSSKVNLSDTLKTVNDQVQTSRELETFVQKIYGKVDKACHQVVPETADSVERYAGILLTAKKILNEGYDSVFPELVDELSMALNLELEEQAHA